MRKLLFLLYLSSYLFKLSAQPTALQFFAQLAPTASLTEKVTARNQVVDFLKTTTNIDQKLQFSLYYQQLAESRQDSIFLGSCYEQLQQIYLELGDPSKQSFFAQKQKEITSNYGFLLSDLSNNYQFLYTALKVLPEKEKRLTLDEVIAKDHLFTINTTAENFQAEQTYWAKLKLRGTPNTSQKGLLFIEGYRNNYSWQYIDAWLLHQDGRIVHQKAGLALSPAEKSNPSHLNYVNFQATPNEAITVYIRVEQGEVDRRFTRLGLGILKDDRNNTAGYQSNGQFPHTSIYSPFKGNLVSSHQFHEDPTGTAPIQQIASNWEQLPQTNVFNTQQQLGKVYWMKQRFIGNEQFQGEQTFFLNYFSGTDYYSFDFMDTYIVDKLGNYTHQRAGDHVQMKNRPYYFWANLIKLDITPTDTLDMYVRLEGADWRYLMPFMGLWHIDNTSFWPTQVQITLREGLFYGILIIQCFYSFLLFVIGRERLQLYLTMLILGIFMALGFLLDDSVHFVLFPTLRDWHIPLFFVGQFLIAYGILHFTKTYFAYRATSIFTKWLIPIYVTVFAILTISAILFMKFRNSDFYFNAGLIGLMLSFIMITIMAYTAKGQRYISKKLYFIAFAPVGLAFLLLALNGLGPKIFNLQWLALVEVSTAYQILKIAVVLMLSLLALSTGHRTNQLKAEKAAVLKTTLANQQQVNQAISRFVPNEFLRALGKETITQINLGDYTQKTVTVFFADIRGYTTLAEQMTPEDNFKFVNDFNGRLGPLIQNNQGFVNQYLGDGLMAIFPHSATDALRAAIQMQLALQGYNKSRKEKKRQPIKVGMGMHTGSLIMGIIGDSNRMDPATISDAVNTASRIENLTKHYAASILLSGASLQNLSNTDEFHFRYLGPVQVKGKQQSIKIHECFDGDPPTLFDLKLATLPDFEAGVQYFFDKEFDKAIVALSAVLQQNPADLTAALYLKKANLLKNRELADDWTGVELMMMK